MISTRPVETSFDGVDRGLRLCEVSKDLTGGTDQLRSGVGYGHASTHPVEEFDPQFALKASNGLGERRLGNVQVCCGPAEAVEVDHGEEESQLACVHWSPSFAQVPAFRLAQARVTADPRADPVPAGALGRPFCRLRLGCRATDRRMKEPAQLEAAFRCRDVFRRWRWSLGWIRAGLLRVVAVGSSGRGAPTGSRRGQDRPPGCRGCGRQGRRRRRSPC